MAKLVDDLRKLRDRLQAVPANLGMPTILENKVEVVGEDGLTIPIAFATLLVSKSSSSEVQVNNGVTASEQYVDLIISTQYLSLVNTSCRFYFNNSEWLPIKWLETTLDLRIKLRQNYDLFWDGSPPAVIPPPIDPPIEPPINPPIEPPIIP